jgi:agmatine deiminase
MIYLSTLLQNKLPKLIAEIERKVPITYLQNTKDIWARDYMPVKIREGAYVQFTYNPTYLHNCEDMRTNASKCTPNDKDRAEKKCEYAVLVSLLEIDNEF